MGTPITNILKSKELMIDGLTNKILAVDSFNMLYQFLSSIRQVDGSPLTDSKGRVTSHLTGLFSRVTRLILWQLKPWSFSIAFASSSFETSLPIPI